MRLLARNGTRTREFREDRSLEELTRRGRADEETLAFKISVIVTLLSLLLEVLKICYNTFKLAEQRNS